MMVVKKKQIVTVAMALILVVAGYINYVYIDKESENQPVAKNIEESVENAIKFVPKSVANIIKFVPKRVI